AGQSSRGQFVAHVINTIIGTLILQPFSQFLQAIFQTYPGLITQQISGFGNVCEAVADIAHAILAGNFRFQFRVIKNLTDLVGDFADAVVFAAANIEDFAIGVAAFQRQYAGLGNVMHADKIAALTTVFKNNWRFIVKKTRGENGKYASVRIG